MVATESIQQLFLDQMKKKLPSHLSLADEMAELLNISRDSAYRRIRGETILSLDEVGILARKFGLSLDSMLASVNNMVSFQCIKEDQIEESLGRWLQSIITYLEMFAHSTESQKSLIFNAKDLPIFHYFQFPGLAAFKMFFWNKFFDRNAFGTSKYKPEEIGREFLALGRKIYEKYAHIESIELITEETLVVTLRQIEYAYDCGLFADPSEPRRLLDECQTMNQHLKKQAATGKKMIYGSEEPLGKFDVYLNQVISGDNSISFKLGDQRVCIITTHTFKIMSTTQEDFCQLTDRHLSRIMDKSVLISVVGEKERLKFFNRIEEEITRTASRIR